MVDHKHMDDAVQRYVAGFENQDLDAILDLYADDATVEDPLGAPLLQGSDAIRAFYEGALGAGVKLRLDGPVRTSAQTAAFPFSIATDPSGEQRLHIIDVLRFNDAGKIVQMQAIWSAPTA